MADTLLDIYGNFNRLMDEYQRDAEEYNKAYYSGAALPERPVEPDRPPFPEYGYGEPLRATSPYELYQTAFGRGTPDVLTNEAWSLANISTPFLASTPETAYDKGAVAKINNPLSYAGPQEFYTGQTDETNQNTMQGQNLFY